MRANPTFYLSIAAAIWLSHATAALSEEPAWEVDQKHRFFGPINIHISKQGLRSDLPRFSVSYIKKAGDDRSYVYSLANKVMYAGKGDSGSELSRIMLLAALSTRSGDLFDWKTIQFKKEKTGMMLGLPADLYVGTKQYYRWEIWTTNALHTPVWMNRAHAIEAKLPPLDGLILKANLKSTRSSGSNDLLTTLSVRKIEPSQVVLVVPPGLKRVNNITEVVSSQTASFFQDVQESLGK